MKTCPFCVLEICEAIDTKDDDVMCTLIETILYGWPEMKADVPSQFASYFHTDIQYKMDCYSRVTELSFRTVYAPK